MRGGGIDMPGRGRSAGRAVTVAIFEELRVDYGELVAILPAGAIAGRGPMATGALSG